MKPAEITIDPPKYTFQDGKTLNASTSATTATTGPAYDATATVAALVRL